MNMNKKRIYHLEDALRDRVKKGERPKAIIIVHLYGQSAAGCPKIHFSVISQVISPCKSTSELLRFCILGQPG